MCKTHVYWSICWHRRAEYGLETDLIFSTRSWKTVCDRSANLRIICGTSAPHTNNGCHLKDVWAVFPTTGSNKRDAKALVLTERRNLWKWVSEDGCVSCCEHHNHTFDKSYWWKSNITDSLSFPERGQRSSTSGSLNIQKVLKNKM